MKSFFMVSGMVEMCFTALFFCRFFLRDLRMDAGTIMALCCAVGWGLLGILSAMLRDLDRSLWKAAEQLPSSVRKNCRWSHGIMLLILAVYSIGMVVLTPYHGLAGLLTSLLFFILLAGTLGLLKIKFVFSCLLQLHIPEAQDTTKRID